MSIEQNSILLALTLLFGTNIALPEVRPSGPSAVSTTVGKAAWGKSAGRQVDLFTLRNGHGMQARITNYGGIVVSLTTPDRQGRYADVVLGYDKLESYLKDSPYFGALIGRYGTSKCLALDATCK